MELEIYYSGERLFFKINEALADLELGREILTNI
jgi:hypothetical protein